MELKARNVYRGACASTFQSHLYGIEREVIEFLAGVKDGFNRTFMELKECSNFSQLDRFGFQSHLYGIERSTLGISVLLVDRFQSHLYGIERGSFARPCM